MVCKKTTEYGDGDGDGHGECADVFVDGHGDADRNGDCVMLTEMVMVLVMLIAMEFVAGVVTISAAV